MKKKSFITGIVSCIIFLIIMLILLCNFIINIKNCSSYFGEQAFSYSQKLTNENSQTVESGINNSLGTIKTIASKVTPVQGFQNLDNIGEQLVNTYKIDCLQFLYEGNASYRYGIGVGSSTSDEFKSLIDKGEFACSHVMMDDSLGVECIAMYGPILNNPDVDGVIAYFRTSDIFHLENSQNDICKLQCIADKDGSIIEIYSKDDLKKDVSHNIYTYLSKLNMTKTGIDGLENDISFLTPNSYEFTCDNIDYIISTSVLKNISSNYILYNIYVKNDIVNKIYPLHSSLYISGIAFVIFCLILILLFIIYDFRRVLKQGKILDIDPVLGCNTFQKFAETTEEILGVNRHSSYSVIYFEINKFNFIRENYGSEMCDSILRYIINIIEKILTDNETYGHITDDRFVLLMHSANFQECTSRIKIITAFISSFQPAKENNFSLVPEIGIYQIERQKNYSVQQCLDRAVIAQNLQKQKTLEPYTVYNSNIRASYMKEAEIEGKMEYALKNNEFKVFYQPKYNIKNDTIDGAEALVRWYNPVNNSYVQPDDFVPLFEVNGFISKLDRYVFASVCEFMHEMLDRNENIVPISVNISRVSATQPDFLSYYISTKQKFQIPNGMLMLEFTESFAFENYEIIGNIVAQLKNAGFKCSIDDFGSGYSSFEILKELSMDEMKLDKMFLNPSSNSKKDAILLKSIIELGNSFNMKVTQEGVETLEQLKQLETFGCTVIQGYYYSKPIPVTDFIDFISDNHSLKSIIKKGHINA